MKQNIRRNTEQHGKFGNVLYGILRHVPSLKQTVRSENRPSHKETSSSSNYPFSGAMAVSFRDGNFTKNILRNTGSTMFAPCYMIKSTLKIARYCSLMIQGFSNFLGLFQVMTRQTPKHHQYWNIKTLHRIGFINLHAFKDSTYMWLMFGPRSEQ